MRETVTEYEPNVEEVESEVVWCDRCTSRCTEDHEVVPMELCSECQPDEEEQEWTMEEYRDAFEIYDGDIDVEMTFEFMAISTIFFPVFFCASILDATEGEHNTARWFIVGGLGASLWFVFVLILFEFL
jgi:hypothetical protein